MLVMRHNYELLILPCFSTFDDFAPCLEEPLLLNYRGYYAASPKLTCTLRQMPAQSAGNRPFDKTLPQHLSYTSEGHCATE